MRSDLSRSVDTPEPGYFAIKLVKGGVRVGARLTYENGLWVVSINGEPKGAPVSDPADNAAIWRVWHGGQFIAESEYTYLIERAAWAASHAPADPYANPSQPVDVRQMAPLF